MSQPAIIEEFLELVQLNVNSRNERLIADVVAAKLKALGLTVEEDATGETIGGNAGNLIARLPGDPAISPLMFSAHLDRVKNHGRIKPIIDGDLIKSDGTSILAADDVSGLCAILDGLRRVRDENIPHGEIEVVFSVAEEVGLLGARYLDYSKIKSKMSYVIDSGGPLGTVVNQAPTQYTFLIKITGKSAHAGIEPEKGLSAIRVGATALTRLREGRLSPRTTSNFGLFNAGTATNIVCQYAEIRGEARSTDQKELADYLQEVQNVFRHVGQEFGAEVEVEVTLEYQTFTVPENDEVITLAGRALKNLGLELKVIGTGGGMDGNFFNQHGLKAVGLAPGYVGVHTPDEQQSVSDLIKCGQLVTEIIRESAN